MVDARGLSPLGVNLCGFESRRPYQPSYGALCTLKELEKMCDYSLHNVPSRDAVRNDKVVTTSFHGTYTCGFGDVATPALAVCLKPGTELRFRNNIRYWRPRLFLWDKDVATKWMTARFRQVNLFERHAHHDAIELPDGTVILLTNLVGGQQADVLQLPSPQVAEEAPEDNTAFHQQWA